MTQMAKPPTTQWDHVEALLQHAGLQRQQANSRQPLIEGVMINLEKWNRSKTAGGQSITMPKNFANSASGNF